MINPEEYLRVGIFRGNFAPVHRGHTEAARAFMEQMKLDYLFVMPKHMDSNEPWNAPHLRLRMCELAFEGVDGVVISDADIKGGGQLGLVGILEELSRPDTRLFILCGTDEVLSFESDPPADRVLSLCYPSYVRRESDPLLSELIVAKITDYYKKYGVMFRKIVKDPVALSSGTVRKKAEGGEDVSALTGEKVARFIAENGLYRR